ncbi:MAG: cytochrome c biogenesis protein CcsA [Brevinematales bacterium]|nr:cytochrome c biogenesis protein CcsA [Brevinematales bacterium]
MNFLIIENILIIISLSGFILSIVVSLLSKKLFYLTYILSLLALLFSLTMRTIISKHPPYSNIYETFIFLAFIYNFKIFFLTKYTLKVKGLLNIPSILLLFGALILPPQLKEISELNPMLNSIWLNIHVPSFFIGYLSLISAFLLAILDKFKIYENDNYSYELKIATLFISIGILSGSIWAKEAWGRFWSWDPKEIGALFILIFSLLSIFIKNKKIQFIILTLATLSLLITYIGLSFFVAGLHSYK